jgi:hypothetical protein
MAFALIILIDAKLAQKRCRHGIRAIASLRLGQIGPFDLRGAQRDIADNALR